MACKTDAGIAYAPAQRVDGMPALGMTYSPWQQWGEVYEAEIGFCRGTIFPCLDKPFLEGACPNV